jgi:hypothetical protein
VGKPVVSTLLSAENSRMAAVIFAADSALPICGNLDWW